MRYDITRRAFVASGAALGIVGPSRAFAQTHPKALMDLAAIAVKKPPVKWSESSEPEAIAKIAPEFNKAWPDIRIEYIRDTGGNTLAAKAIQETQAGGSPAAFLNGDSQQFNALEQRGLLVHPDWAALGVDPKLVATPYMFASTASIGVLVWNTKNVSDADRPRTIDDLTLPKWSGKVGSWIRAPNYATLAEKMGEDRMREWLRKLIENKVRVYDSTYRLAQEVGSGEIDVGYGLYHTVQPTIASGGPVAFALTNPLSVGTLFGCVVAKSANPEGAQVLAAWLATKEGADAYEAATGRGNPSVAGSRAAKLVEGFTLSEFPVSQMATQNRIMTEFNRMLSSRGAAK